MVKTLALHKLDLTALQQRKAALLSGCQLSPGLVRASYVRQYLTCGKKNCRCRRGFKHGPFYYLVQCLGTGKVRKFLLKTPAQRQQARAGIAAHLKFQRRLAELSEINTELLRRAGNS
ncbi:MAG: DUF6788 family protein [Verrucomicrobiota bacterium]